jgi:nitrogen fixation NifU-like protein
MKWLESVGARIVPGNFGPLQGFHAHARVEGGCGDTMEFWVALDGDRIIKASFTTDGCATSVACGSAAAAMSRGLSLLEANHIRPIDVLDALGVLNTPEADEARHCAVLAVEALGEALEAYAKRLQEPVGSAR